MNDTRFLTILNQAARQSGLDITAPASPSDPAAVAAWAAFLRRCVLLGASIADPRWGALEVRMRGGLPVLFLASGPDTERAEVAETDFTLGLSLLMTMLGQSPDMDDP